MSEDSEAVDLLCAARETKLKADTNRLEQYRVTKRQLFLNSEISSDVWPLDALAFHVVCMNRASEEQDVVSEDFLTCACMDFVFKTSAIFDKGEFARINRQIYRFVSCTPQIHAHQLQFFASFTACMQRRKVVFQQLHARGDTLIASPVSFNEMFVELAQYVARASGGAASSNLDLAQAFDAIFPTAKLLTEEEKKCVGLCVTNACLPVEYFFS